MEPRILRRALANHTDRDGYRLILIHHRGDRRYDLDGQPVGTVTEADRAEATRLLEASTRRGQAEAEQVRIHQAREEKRQKQREMERRNREAKAARKAENLRRREEAAARKAVLIAQGIVPEPRSKHRYPPGPFSSKPRPQHPLSPKPHPVRCPHLPTRDPCTRPTQPAPH